MNERRKKVYELSKIHNSGYINDVKKRQKYKIYYDIKAWFLLFWYSFLDFMKALGKMFLLYLIGYKKK